MSPSSSHSSSAISLPMHSSLSRQNSRQNSFTDIDAMRPLTPLTPKTPKSLTKQQDPNSLERVASRAESTNGHGAHQNNRSTTDLASSSTGLVSRMMSSFSLSRNSTDDKERGRSAKASRESRTRSHSSATISRNESDVQSLRSRSQSPFHLRRFRTRDRSPSVGAIAQSDAESDTDSIRPRGSAYFSDDDESDSDADEDDSLEDTFDPLTEANTERNALAVPQELPDYHGEIADPLGEGQNVVVPPEPYFPTTLNETGARNPRRRKSTRYHEPLPFKTGRPAFKRDRCTITITQGDPAAALENTNRKPRMYMVASDISEESRYAVEWAIGTVLRDGDEL
jgi:hypothetical protein